ncbi:hypothetical protein AOLI_G00189060 [Acnodon oligacanthus]
MVPLTHPTRFTPLCSKEIIYPRFCKNAALNSFSRAAPERLSEACGPPSALYWLWSSTYRSSASTWTAVETHSGRVFNPTRIRTNPAFCTATIGQKFDEQLSDWPVEESLTSPWQPLRAFWLFSDGEIRGSQGGGGAGGGC